MRLHCEPVKLDHTSFVKVWLRRFHVSARALPTSPNTVQTHIEAFVQAICLVYSLLFLSVHVKVQVSIGCQAHLSQCDLCARLPCFKSSSSHRRFTDLSIFITATRTVLLRQQNFYRREQLQAVSQWMKQ